MSWVYQINGKLDIAALAQALDDVVARHEMLRTRFEGDEQVVMGFQPGVLKVIAVDDRPKLEALATAVRAVEIEYQDLCPYDDARLQASLYMVAPKTNVLCIVVAEALVDGDSGTLVAAEISRAYALHAGKPVPQLAEANKERFFDHIESHPLSADAEAKADAHWRTMVVVPQEAGTWPTVTGDRNAVHFFQIPAEAWDELVAATPGLATVPFVVVLAWLEIALAKVAGAENFYVTSAVSSRRLPATRTMIGNFVGPVRMTAHVHADDTLADVTPRVMTQWRSVLANGVVPIPVIEARVQEPAPYCPPPPLVSFFLFAEREGLDLAGVRQRRFRVHTGSKDILRVNCTPDGEGGRNFFFISASAPKALVDELATTFRSVMGVPG